MILLIKINNEFFQECDEVDPRFSSQGVRDTSFSWESIDSQVGSKQSLLDNKGRSRLLKSQEAKVLSGGQAWTGGGHCTGGGQSPGDRRGNAGDRGQTDDMDLTRRQREQRKKDLLLLIRLLRLASFRAIIIWPPRNGPRLV